MNYDVVAITRHNAVTHETVVLVAHTAFKEYHGGRVSLRHVHFGGVLEEILFEMKTVQTSNESLKG